jgi:hypothetical protein
MVVVSLDAIEGIRSISTEDPSFLINLPNQFNVCKGSTFGVE